MVTSNTSARLAANKKRMNFLIFSKIFLPSFIAVTMVAKLSSIIMRSATSRLTSLPLIPIATPTSAAFRAGASLTPSPVTATT